MALPFHAPWAKEQTDKHEAYIKALAAINEFNDAAVQPKSTTPRMHTFS
jgi:hypothetical protein